MADMSLSEFDKVVWSILGEMEERNQAFTGSMAEAASSTLCVAYAVAFHGVTNYAEWEAWTP